MLHALYYSKDNIIDRLLTVQLQAFHVRLVSCHAHLFHLEGNSTSRGLDITRIIPTCPNNAYLTRRRAAAYNSTWQLADWSQLITYREHTLLSSAVPWLTKQKTAVIRWTVGSVTVMKLHEMGVLLLVGQVACCVLCFCHVTSSWISSGHVCSLSTTFGCPNAGMFPDEHDRQVYYRWED